MSQPQSPLAAFLLDTLDDLERSLDGIDADDAERPWLSFSSMSWTVAHLAHHVDSWIAGRAGQPRNSYLMSSQSLISSQFSHDSTGHAVEWRKVRVALSEVLAKARSFLAAVSEADLAQVSVYRGSSESVKGKLVTGNYRLARLIAHIYYHIGTITTTRAAIGKQVGDFPSVLPISLEVLSAKP